MGTASWTDRSLLDSSWYPKGVNSAEERLAHYASRFRLVEVDSTYYFLPQPSVVRAWTERTPDDFTFDVKAFSLFTQHPTRPQALPPNMAPDGKQRVYLKHLAAADVDDLWERFIRALGPLHKKGKLASLLFQFPPWFSIQRQNKDYLVECAERARPYRVAVEFRSPTWLTKENRDETFEFLKGHGLAYVCVDGPRRKGVVPALPEATSADLAVVRFHGRGRGEGGDAEGQPEAEYLYPTRVLESWVPKLRDLAKPSRAVHAVFRNQYRDYAPRSAERLQRLLANH